MNASPFASCRHLLRVFSVNLRKALWNSFCCIFFLLLTQIGSAATYTVTNTSDTGAGSLRAALTSVNAGSGGDTIVFSGVTGTITLGTELGISQSVSIHRALFKISNLPAIADPLIFFLPVPSKPAFFN